MYQRAKAAVRVMVLSSRRTSVGQARLKKHLIMTKRPGRSMISRPSTPIKKPPRSHGQIFKVSQFLCVVEDQIFAIQVLQSSDGHLTAHADSTSAPHETLHPVSGLNLDNVLESMTAAIDKKVCAW